MKRGGAGDSSPGRQFRELYCNQVAPSASWPLLGSSHGPPLIFDNLCFSPTFELPFAPCPTSIGQCLDCNAGYDLNDAGSCGAFTCTTGADEGCKAPEMLHVKSSKLPHVF